MKIKINKKGLLIINQAEKYCPYQEAYYGCGYWCALFVGVVYNPSSELVIVELCRKSYSCLVQDFTDERTPDEETVR
jgi:hypothetical protein